MNLVDRYLLALFLRIFVICFISFTGLFIVIHLSTNLDELVEAGEVEGGLGKVLFEFYGPRALDIFDRSAGILVLLAAIFALGLVERKREMVAIQSAGIPKLRLVRPILVGAIAILLLAVANRELLLPKFKEQLVRTPQTWLDGDAIPMTFQKDVRTGLVIRGSELNLGENKIMYPDVQIPREICEAVTCLKAESATFEEAKPHRPAGLLLRNVTSTEHVDHASISFEGTRLVYLPADNEWLSETQCFLAIDLDPKKIAFGKQMNLYDSLPEKIDALRQPQVNFGRGPQVAVHSRVLQPIMDLTLLLLGLPLVIGRFQQNVFTSAALCLSLVLVVQLVTFACHNLGAVSVLRPAALAVWLPVIIFLPAGVVGMRRLLK